MYYAILHPRGLSKGFQNNWCFMVDKRFSLFSWSFQGNVGDSRAIASKKGAVEQLSYDHKPSNDGNADMLVVSYCKNSFSLLISC